jgi:hypothetical protein
VRHFREHGIERVVWVLNMWAAIGALILSLAAIAGAVGFVAWLGGMAAESGTPIDEGGPSEISGPDFRASYNDETKSMGAKPKS